MRFSGSHKKTAGTKNIKDPHVNQSDGYGLANMWFSVGGLAGTCGPFPAFWGCQGSSNKTKRR